MGLFSVHVLVFSVVCATLILGSSGRSTSYNYGGYGQKAPPPAVAANGNGRRSGPVMSASEPPKALEQTKGATQDKKSSGPAMSAWGIIAIIMTLGLSLMGVYYFTLFYPILCKKERNYDVMDLGSQ